MVWAADLVDGAWVVLVDEGAITLLFDVEERMNSIDLQWLMLLYGTFGYTGQLFWGKIVMISIMATK